MRNGAVISYLKTSIARGGWPARVVVGMTLVAAALLFAIVVDAALSYNRIHPGVTISGHEVGRMTREAAEADLSRRIEEASASQIVLTSEDRSWPLFPAEVGTKIDVQGTVEDAFALTRQAGFVSDLRTRFALYVTPREVPLRGTVDTALMDQLIGQIAAALDRPPVNAGLKIVDRDISVIEGEDGLVVDRDTLRAQLKELLFSLHSTELAIPMMVQAPAIKAADTSDAVQQARTMLSAEIALKLEDSVWTLSPEKIAAYMDFTTEGSGSLSKLVPYLSAEKAQAFLSEVAPAVERKPRDATWETDGETATLVPGQTGRALDAQKTAESLTLAAQSPTDRVAPVGVTETQPGRTTEIAESMGIVSKLAGFTTEFGGSEGRRDNVQQAAKLISGTILAPGEEFDFDTIVGPRTVENGFKTAPAIINGKLEDTLGGGICQVSTTLFNAVFFAGLDVTARTNHSLYISHYPKGRDATVSWGGPAFRFRNDTSRWILIKAASSRSSLTFVIYGTPSGRQVTYTTGDWYNIQPPTEKRVKTDDLLQGEERIVDSGQTGKKVKVVRKVVESGKTIHEDTFFSTYPMKPKIIEEGTKPPPTTTTTTAPTTTTTTPSTSTTSTTTATTS